MLLNIPYLSQHTAATDPYWKPRACAIVCIKLVGDFMFPGSMPSVDDLIHEGETVGGFSARGWRHDYLAILLRNHGVLAYNQEYRTADAAQAPQYVPSVFTEQFLEAALLKIIHEIKAGRPVIVSVPGKQGLPTETHMVVVLGIEERDGRVLGLYCHNPDTQSPEEGRNVFISIEDFLSGWRRFCLYVES